MHVGLVWTIEKKKNSVKTVSRRDEIETNTKTKDVGSNCSDVKRNKSPNIRRASSLNATKFNWIEIFIAFIMGGARGERVAWQGWQKTIFFQRHYLQRSNADTRRMFSARRSDPFPRAVLFSSGVGTQDSTCALGTGYVQWEPIHCPKVERVKAFF